MARRPVLGGGSGLSPFGTSQISFSAFNVASKSEKAYLAFAKVQAAYDAGQVDDDAYLAALKAYAASLKPSDSSYYSAQSRVADTEYSITRNKLTEGLTKGTKTWQDLIDFDAKELAAVSANPDSDVYRTRQGRLWDSQTGQYREAEKDISEQLSKGTMTYTQALAWYQQKAAAYRDNPDLLAEINDRIDQAKGAVTNERDQKEVDDWKAGKVDLPALIAYARNAIQSDPNSDRAKTWQDNLDSATKDAVQKSLAYRYGLTEEYKQLELLVASTAPAAGHTTVSQTTKTIMGADGQWRTVTSQTGTYHPPSAAEQAAYREALLKADAAKKRMAEIVRMVGQLPGGWVTEDDMVATLASQQAGLVKGTPDWLALQSQIDDYRSRKAADDLLTQQGVRISLPGVGTERAASPYVGAQERPVAAGSGRASVPTIASGGGGGGGGSSSGTGSAAHAAVSSAAVSAPFQRITGLKPGDPTGYARQSTGFPAMDADRYAHFYKEFTAAIREGKDVWRDPYTGVSYYIPPSPESRLKMMQALDDSNIALQQQKVGDRAGTGKDQDAATWGLIQAQRQRIENTIWLMDAKTVGVPKSRLPQNQKDVANPIAAGVELMDKTAADVAFYAQQAKTAWDNGDYTRALGFVRQATALVADPKNGGGLTAVIQKITGYSLTAQDIEGQAAYYGVDITGKPAEDIKRLENIDAWAKELWDKTGLGDLATNFAPPSKGGAKSTFFKFDSVGNPVIVGGEVQLADDTKLVYDQSSGTIKPEKASFGGLRADGTVDWSSPGSKTVTASVVLGGRVVPVEVPYGIGAIGTVGAGTAYARPIRGRTVDIVLNGQHMVLGENPFQPGQWLPIVDSTGKAAPIKFTLPPNMLVLPNPSSALGATDAPQFAFSLGGPTPGQRQGQSTNYVLALNNETGTYQLYQFVNGAPQLVSNLDPLSGGGAGLDILRQAGISIDRNSLTADQRAILNAGVGTAFFGSATDLAHWKDASAPKVPVPAPVYHRVLTGEKGDEAVGFVRGNALGARPPGVNDFQSGTTGNSPWAGPSWSTQQEMANILLGVRPPQFATPQGPPAPSSRSTPLPEWTPPPVQRILVGTPGDEAVAYRAKPVETPTISAQTGFVLPNPSTVPVLPTPKPTPISPPPAAKTGTARVATTTTPKGKTQTKVALHESLVD